MDERLAQTPEQSHLSPEMLADLLSGEIEDDDLRQRVVPHLLARCPACRRRVDGIRRLQERFDHWSESVVVREGQEAPRLLAALLDHPEDSRLHRLSTDEGFHTWGLTQLLLQKSRELVHSEPHQAVDLAELAVVAADFLAETAYHPEWIGDLKARAWAVLGNARRVAGELTSSEAAFRRALALLLQVSTGRPWIRAEILDLLASLRREQGRLVEALQLLDEAASVYRTTKSGQALAKIQLTRAKTLEEKGDIDESATLLQQILSSLDPGRDTKMAARARTNLVGCLIRLDRFTVARRELRTLEESLELSELERWRLQWLKAQIADGLEEWRAAETLFLETQAWFLDRRLAFDAALVSLDLALLYARTGRDTELQELAAEVLPLFQVEGAEREVLAALLLFQQSVERKSLTAELIREVREVVRRRRRPRGKAPGESPLNG